MAQYSNVLANASNLGSLFCQPSKPSSNLSIESKELIPLCVFCDIVEQKVNTKLYYEDDSYICFADRHPKSDFHCLIIPKVHRTNVKELNKFDGEMLSDMRRIGSQILVENGITVEKQRMGFHIPPFYSVDHLHLHLLSLPLPTISAKLKYYQSEPKNKIKGLSWFISISQCIQLLEKNEKVRIGSSKN